MSKQIFQKALQNLEAATTSWLATVIETDGSTPGRIGMKILIHADGKTSGTIGGGAIEHIVIQKVLQERPGKATRWCFDLGGNPAAQNTSKLELTGMICGGGQEIFIEPLFNQHGLYIIGGGHCGQALSELATKCDFSVTVIDDRAAYLDKTLHPFAANLICAPYSDVAKHIYFSPDIFIVVLTHGHKHDELVLREVINKDYKYLGVIGSKIKARAIFRKMAKDQFSDAQLRRVFSPIGLKIGSQTPYEIAVSIMAQVIAAKNNIGEVTFNTNPLLPE